MLQVAIQYLKLTAKNALTSDGWPNGKENCVNLSANVISTKVNASQRKCAQVNASARKPWPNGDASGRKFYKVYNNRVRVLMRALFIWFLNYSLIFLKPSVLKIAFFCRSEDKYSSGFACLNISSIFVILNHSYDYRPNWTPPSPITIIKHTLWLQYCSLSSLKWKVAIFQVFLYMQLFLELILGKHNYRDFDFSSLTPLLAGLSTKCGGNIREAFFALSGKQLHGETAHKITFHIRVVVEEIISCCFYPISNKNAMKLDEILHKSYTARLDC